ncbi:hypothetical protein IHQ71_18745 [Rhizobium sp. TH2]|uniref:CPCC family cysteine-rich protein n=1 Tax=Rhizobium sp. TH2 TaxID=2775403 RepID=UPI0021583FFD|nr:CPCC family cysteine-rich protein [Rhizobium sp. TH2]UVC07245.1 hypothetical protein IHQ71_18745 [Rhizobium sp. TH2]
MHEELHPCPCCKLPTLEWRNAFDVCVVCFWEDDSQDDPHADEVWHGPNEDYSLTRARENFADHLHMYDDGRAISQVEFPSAGRIRLLEYVKSVLENPETLDKGRVAELIEGWYDR